MGHTRLDASRRRGWTIAAAALLLLPSVAAAEPPFELPSSIGLPGASTDPTRPAPAPHPEDPSGVRGLTVPFPAFNPSGSFVSAYLSPRMTTRLHGIGQVVGSAIYRTEPVASEWRDEIARSAATQAIRAARGAARDYLIDRWDLEIDLRRDAGGVTLERARNAGPSGLRLGLAGLLPRMTWRTSTPGGSLKLGLDGRGRLSAAWARTVDRSASLGATVDPSQRRIEAGWRGGF